MMVNITVCGMEPELTVLCFPTCPLLALKGVGKMEIREGMEKQAPLENSYFLHTFFCVA